MSLLRISGVTPAPDEPEPDAAAAGDPVHVLPDAPRARRGPFGVSAIVHALVILALVLKSHFSPEPKKPVPGANMGFAMELILAPIIQDMIANKSK